MTSPAPSWGLETAAPASCSCAPACTSCSSPGQTPLAAPCAHIYSGHDRRGRGTRSRRQRPSYRRWLHRRNIPRSQSSSTPCSRRRPKRPHRPRDKPVHRCRLVRARAPRQHLGRQRRLSAVVERSPIAACEPRASVSCRTLAAADVVGDAQRRGREDAVNELRDLDCVRGHAQQHLWGRGQPETAFWAAPAADAIRRQRRPTC
jgi:hypothetical protein